MCDAQDFNALRSHCIENKILFEDPEFPADDSSLQFSGPADPKIKWLRPHEIADKPRLFVDGYSRFDVNQGHLGNCWMLAATATLAQKPELFLHVVPDDQSFKRKYAGIFHFKFWRYGRWIDIVVDDRLPTSKGKLKYMKSTEKNEFWGSLLEKAYAKFHGSYELLKGGKQIEAMVDFTGGVSETYFLGEDAPSNLFKILIKSWERNSLIGCTCCTQEAKPDEGLMTKHAYSITKVKLVGEVPLLRLRNPHGRAEWTGPWSDKSKEWLSISDEKKREIELKINDDGEFWMSYDDWVKRFQTVEICHLSPDSWGDEQTASDKNKWELDLFDGEWVQGSSAGGSRNHMETYWQNPQYFVTLKYPDENDEKNQCALIVALMQKNRRSPKVPLEKRFLSIGFAIYTATEQDLQNKPLKKSFFENNKFCDKSAIINLREVSMSLKVSPGHYVIVPCTFKPNEEAEFFMRVFHH